MTYLIELLTSFRGRIGRKSFWLGMAILVAASYAGRYVLNPGAFNLDLNSVPKLVWAETIWQLMLFVPGTALMVKRFNDRDRPHWLGYAYGVLGALVIVAPHFGFFVQPDLSAVEVTFLVFIGVTYLYAFVETCGLHGDNGPNRYGPDPLEPRKSQAQ